MLTTAHEQKTKISHFTDFIGSTDFICSIHGTLKFCAGINKPLHQNCQEESYVTVKFISVTFSKMSSKSSGGTKRPPKRILPKENPNDVIYFMSQIDESSINSLDHRLIVPKVEIQESEPVYQIIEQSTVDVALEDDETNLVEGHVVYVREGECDDEAEDSVTFMQVGGPDVASEETIETSMIIEIPPEDNSEPKSSSHLSSDHCYTFKKGIRPRDLDRVKARAAMTGDNGDIQSISQQPYAFILPKQLEAPIKKISQKSFESKRSEFRRATVKETKGGKHRWLWQFMKELLFIGDPCLKWYNQKEGTFFVI